ncbi:Arsenate reductase OS=Castellaniella defragrans OX=75697 GN=HNR28_003542 PE=3 SV=1 [Castellaniella defragrans]
MSYITIFIDPECPTCRKALALLKENGARLNIIEYMGTSLTEAQIKTLLSGLGMTAREMLRQKSPLYEQLNLKDPAWNEEELIVLMSKHPELISRPVAVSSKGTKLCRPAELVLDLL